MFENSEKIFLNSNVIDDEKKFTIIHFNDIYNIESRAVEPVGGASRFVTVIEQLIQQNPTLVLFSGDALSPSLIGMFAKGKQVIDVLNKCHISCACLGNHDFDYGVDILTSRIEESTFPWILSNVFDAETKKPLGDVEDRKVVEINGYRIGLIGLVEEEWMSTLSTVSYDEVNYESYVTAGKRLALELKNEQNCDFVFALTHMRWNNDTILANEVPEIDLFLGGHDHDYVVKNINDRWVVKSGTDFRDVTVIEIASNEKKLHINKIERLPIVSSIEEHAETKAIVDFYINKCNEGLEEVLGQINVDLDGRFSQVRSRETNLGNFFCDILLNAVKADCALLNSGSFRSDQIHKAGDFKMRDLRQILPFLDESIVIQVTGRILHQMLENGVSKYPSHDGRFLQSSGVLFSFDPSQPAGKRIDPRSIKVQNELIEFDKAYTLATKEYLYNGKDGFDCLIGCPVIIDGEDIPALPNLVINHFKAISELKANKPKRFRPSIISLISIEKLLTNVAIEQRERNKNENLKVEAATEKKDDVNDSKLSFSSASSIISKLRDLQIQVLDKKQRKLSKESESFKTQVAHFEKKAMDLAPLCEDRINIVNSS